MPSIYSAINERSKRNLTELTKNINSDR